MKRRFYIESLGCAKNQVDSEQLILILQRLGLSRAADPADAGCLFVNTCGFIASAKRESIDTVLDFRARFPGKKIILVGCLALRYQTELERELGEVDGVWGDIRRPDFPAFAAKVLSLKPRPIGASSPAAAGPLVRGELLSYPGSVYVKIAEGCANRCSYCAIPLIRGGLKSRDRADIVGEARAFLERGLLEINIIAQDTSSFGRDRGEPELPALLAEISSLPGDFWLRLLYLHPDRLTPEMLEAAAASPTILPYFDIPFQHGSAPILKAMNRHGGADEYLALAGRIRERLPRAVLRTTFLVGFPGESDADFARLLEFQSRLRPEWAGVFAYSAEEGTPAYKLKPRVPKKTARERQAELEKRQTEITHAWLDGRIGSEVDVLFEEKVEGEDLVLGRAWFQAPEVDGLVVVGAPAGACAPGTRRRVRIEGRSGVDLRGVIA